MSQDLKGCVTYSEVRWKVIGGLRFSITTTVRDASYYLTSLLTTTASDMPSFADNALN